MVDETTIYWDEVHLAEDPAVELLQTLGYTYVSADSLDGERESLRDVILVGRLLAQVKKLNPWISDENAKKVTRTITHVQATTLIEANEAVHRALTYGVSSEGEAERKRGQTVHFIDFENPDRNEFLVTRQFRVVRRGGQGAGLIVPDAVAFVNGIPLAIIECKSPTIRDPVEHGIKQILRYQELDPAYEETGAPYLFHTAQILVSTCGQRASYGTVGTPARKWHEWKIPYPLTLDGLQKKLGRVPTPQDVLLYGMLVPENFLDLIQNFVAFETEDGKRVKKLARYQQFAAVNKAVERIRKEKIPLKRGGVVWHTQGSGKSLIMLFLAVKLRRMKELENPTLLVVTDRKDLDRQIKNTFQNCGFPNPEHAERIVRLRKYLTSGTGRTVITTIQKFMDLRRPHPVLSESSNIFVMVDEAHRTQYKSLAANMRHALPNAVFLGFTGTPIDKLDRSTRHTFGNYIDTYTIEQAVQDHATVPIYYEGRLPELQVQGQSLDRLFERVFRDYSLEERERIKSRYVTEEAIAGSRARVEQICLDLIQHFEKFIRPNGFKAQVVTVNRETAVLYKQTLDRLGSPQCALIMSLLHGDQKCFLDAAVPRDKHKDAIEDFLNKEHPLAILIVCDMLITGFDAPVEQVMYLDSPLKEHTLLQAIARVNRPEDGKDYGLVVDYWGVSRDLQEALSVFHPEDIEGALRPKSDELPRLESRHQAVMRFFQQIDRSNLEAAIHILEPEDVRAEFDLAFRRFSRSLDMLLPDPAGLRFMPDMKWLANVRSGARTRFRDQSLDMSGVGEKVKKLIEEHIIATGVQQLLEPVSIFSRRFDAEVAKLSSEKVKASEMEHAIRHEIHVHLEENPVFFRSLKERLETIIEARKQERIDAAEELNHLSVIIREIRTVRKRAHDLGMTEDEFAFYKLLEAEDNIRAAGGQVAEQPDHYGESSQLDEEKRKLATEIVNGLREDAVIDWQYKEDVQREMRSRVKRHLRASGIRDEIEVLTGKIMDLARVRLAS